MPQCCKYKFKPSNANIYNAQVFLRRKSINWWPKIWTKNHVWLKNIFKFQRIFHVQTLAAGKNLNKLVHSFIVIWIWFWIISQLQIMKNWSLIVFSQNISVDRLQKNIWWCIFANHLISFIVQLMVENMGQISA